MVGRAFMHEVNIVPPLSHARFFLTQQVIYNSKIEKNNVSLDIFVSDTSILVFVPLKIKQRLRISDLKITKYLHRSMIGKMIMHM